MAGLLAALLICWGSVDAEAVEGLFLTWDDCAGGAGISNKDFACDTDDGVHLLYCAFTAGAIVDSILGVEIVVDVQHSSPTLPDWWRFQVAGCRDGELTADELVPGASCPDLWLGAPTTGGLQSYSIGMPYGGNNQARIRAALNVVPSSDLKTVDASSMYYAVRLVFENLNTSGGCPGCAAPACLVLNSMILRRPPQSQDVLLIAPGAGDANRATWQGGVGADCQSVPSKTMIWGAIKARYR